MIDIGAYSVNIRSRGEPQIAQLSFASQDEMPINWVFYWDELWQRTYFESERIIKLTYTDQVFGLIRYAIYPNQDDRQFLEILHLEANPVSSGKTDSRSVEPIGKWLIWYSAKTALTVCSNSGDHLLVILTSVEDAIDYYRDKVGMEFIDFETIAPGEEGYVFGFKRSAAAEFCRQQEALHGKPSRLDRDPA
ncbi:hypothetical protein Pse7367_2523 [Thalassoporum mexicanum PCC 7367]|uniref:hypothetical protein n=1 Tax=Thalassoporum mexicanum TaxID=3457544 RepID=UPI00029FF531|nr:hypothetical protein [Pseudanabaena sp. PCC 7367]AFY70783.1 hypothetical protein Pse7367_2523 [Pseudanabaena sp. PCC 7367]